MAKRNPGRSRKKGNTVTESVDKVLKRAARGRKEPAGIAGQEAVIRLEVVHEREEELIRLHTKAKDAAEDLSTAINKTAEDSGLNAAAVKKYVAAKANDTYEVTQKKVQQMALVFEVGG